MRIFTAIELPDANIHSDSLHVSASVIDSSNPGISGRNSFAVFRIKGENPPNGDFVLKCFLPVEELDRLPAKVGEACAEALQAWEAKKVERDECPHGIDKDSGHHCAECASACADFGADARRDGDR